MMGQSVRAEEGLTPDLIRGKPCLEAPQPFETVPTLRCAQGASPPQGERSQRAKELQA